MTLSSLEGLALPQNWRASLHDYQWQRQAIGRSGNAVFKLTSAHKPTFFIKVGTMQAELEHEAACLAWLNRQAIPSARLIDHEVHESHQWLLIGAVNGCSLAESPELVPESIIEITADALRSLHACATAQCPFNHTLSETGLHLRETLATAIAANQVPATTLTRFDELLAKAPAENEWVVTHGDPCLPNLMAEQGRFSGFIDCGHLGLADRHRDLAMSAWSIGYNLGEEWITPFLRLYGDVDEEKLNFYTEWHSLL